MNPVRRIPSKGRPEVLKTWLADFDQLGGTGEGEGGQVGQLNLCVETMNPSCEEGEGKMGGGAGGL